MRLFVAIYLPADSVDHLAAFVADLHVGKAQAAGVNPRLAPRETYHLTVAFLGDVPDARLPDAEAAISAAVTSWHTHAARDLRRAARRDLQRDAGLAAGDPRAHTRRSGAPDAGADPADHVASAPGSPAGAAKGPRKPQDRGGAGKAPQVWIAGGGRFGRGRFSVLWAGVHGETERLAALTRAVRRELKRARLPYDERPWRPHLTIARPGDRLDRAQLGADRAALAAYRGPAWPASELVLVRSHLGPTPSYDRLTGWPL
ncbi:MAG TPA: 2'-5' RNA ligase family protein [Asanoa sp.]